MSKSKLYRVQFQNKGEMYEIYVENVFQGDIFGFIVVENFVFGSRSSVVVDPGEEKLRKEFESVKRSFIPMHSVIRIDEVEKQGVSKITDLDSKITQFPGSIYTPTKI
ncbi:MAG: DUF1820 family protein [Pseudomonadota bacterium]